MRFLIKTSVFLKIKHLRNVFANYSKILVDLSTRLTFLEAIYEFDYLCNFFFPSALKMLKTKLKYLWPFQSVYVLCRWSLPLEPF